MTEVMSDFVLHHRSGITVLTSIERFVISGSTHSDGLIGASGNDWLNGGGGIDTYKGSNGDDGYVFDSSDEFVTGNDAGVDTIWTTASQDLNRSAGVENLRLQSGDINGTGNALANLITGSAGNNIIAGGAGKDSLYGKGGADTFVFSEFGAANKDSIWDFDQNDKIALSKTAFGALDANDDGQFDAMALNFTGKAIGTNAQVIYNKATGNLSYDDDGVGAHAAQDIAFIGKNLAYLSADHFSLTA